MGKIRVRFYGALNLIPAIKADRTVLKNGVPLAIAERASVADVLKQFEIPEKHVHMAFIGKKRVMLDASLKDGDTLHLFPIMGGG